MAITGTTAATHTASTPPTPIGDARPCVVPVGYAGRSGRVGSWACGRWADAR